MQKILRTDWNAGKKNIKDIYDGTAVLIANGPSLADVPQDFLDSHKTIGTNNIYLRGLEDISKYPDVPPGFVPDFYTILGIDQVDKPEDRTYCRPVIEAAELAFVNRMFYPNFDLPHVYAIHGVKVSTGQRPFNRSAFSYDILDYIGIGYTNTYIMFQVLYYLGFKEVLCVGLDNDYGVDPDKLHFYNNDPRFACEPGMGRSTFVKGSNYVFGLVKDAYEKDNRRVININKVNNTPFEWRMPEW